MPSETFDPRRPFTRADARAAGLAEWSLRTPRFRQVFFGVYVLASVRDSVPLRAAAALKLAGPDAYVSHFTAGEILDLCPPKQPLVHVSVPRGRARTRAAGISAHDAAESSLIVRGGQPVSAPVQVFLELGACPSVNLVDLTVVADRIIRKRFATPTDLIAAADAYTGRGVRLARRAARLARRGVDSPMETRLRLLIVLAGLPEPRTNLTLRYPDGDWNIRLDLSYAKQKLIIEYDGRQHAESSKQWLHDLARREQLDGWGWRIIVVTSEGIFGQPAETLRRVEAAARERGVPDVPRILSDEWRRHFTVQA